LAAVPFIPRMLKKRRELRPKRRLSPRQLKRLILEHRISLRELSEHANS
jgi:hypothetical protein